MKNKNKVGMYVLVLAGCLLTAGMPGHAASAEKQLQKGITAYQQNDNDKALDYFIDVLMNGDSEQVRQANQYIDAIHNQIGGIKNPVEVDISFPDQPTQTIINKSENLANYGTEQLSTLADRAGDVVQDANDLINKENKTLTEQIEARQLEGYLQEQAQPIVQQKAALLEQPTVLQEEIANQVNTARQDLEAIAKEFNEQNMPTEVVPAGTARKVTAVQPVVQTPVETLPVVTEPVIVIPAGNVPVDTTVQEPVAAAPVYTPVVPTTALTMSQANPDSATLFADLTSDDAVRARNLYTAQKLQSMKDSALASLSSEPGVHVYMRADGRPDAIDIDDGVLFQGNSFRPESFSTLNDIYEVLALTQDAQYVILPAGSYTDDVTLAGIRQAMALHSYLVKRGISQGKLYYNMGLVDQEVPAQFSNLKGLSIVFDYDAKLPTRLVDNATNETAPLLSMAIVPPCHAIDRSLGEAYAIDFSVLETVDTLDNWMLQIIQHGRDGNYYIVRQLEGFAPVYHQILWNGRKGIIGPELPCGKYTVVLTGVDVKGNKQTLRRRLIVKCNGTASLGSCETGTCNVKATAKKATALNYKAARLWKKPGRVMGGVAKEVVVEQKVEEVAPAVQEHSTATSTSSNTYTVTKTVRNIVTDDNSSSSTTTTSSYSDAYAPLPPADAGYIPATANPYDMPYEEVYTETSTY
ncbi:MAG: hypothetical protein J6X06_01410 [Elusimicrobiaceae bacterium]|nr:hypothetical protein [Elusimicrobiaceae bacterium]